MLTYFLCVCVCVFFFFFLVFCKSISCICTLWGCITFEMRGSKFEVEAAMSTISLEPTKHVRRISNEIGSLLKLVG